MRKGIAVSPGISVGTAYCIHEIFVAPDAKRLDDREVTAELARYEVARDRASAELRALQSKVNRQVGRDAGAIFAVHEAILRDAAFTNRVRGWIVSDRLTAQAALQKLLEEYTQLFSRTDDEYLRERLADVRDVVIRLSEYLSEVLKPESRVLEGPLIVVADELLPSQAVALGDTDVHGIVTERGSQTSHAAIIARSRGIPAIAGVAGILRAVKTGDTLVVDGRTGHVAVNPDSEVLSAFRKLEREFFDLRDQLVENRDQPAELADGTRIQLLANINSVSDAEAAVTMGADGVGLYRTEYLYLTHPDVPDEDEQLASYRQIVHASPHRSVTIRTLDIGGDKTVPYLGHTHQEANPFLGWRSIRLSFEHPEFFMTQVKAILRAAADVTGHCEAPSVWEPAVEASAPAGPPSHVRQSTVAPGVRRADAVSGEVRIMFPMITTLEEMRKVRSMVRRAERQLQQDGKLYGRVPIGMMLEVPAAAVTLNDLIDVVDFVSIGSNDLVQYLMAADRDNPKVSHLCQPLSPAVIRLLYDVIRTCHHHQKPVTLCGEMAGQPQAFILLLGMGLRRFSMSPAFVPRMKKLASLVSQSEARDLLASVLKLKTADQVKRHMTAHVQRCMPDFALLDSN